jgi:hypothetical protein
VDEQWQGGQVRRRRSRAETEQLVAEYEVSGLSRVEFCRKQGLSLATLARYRKRREQGRAVAADGWLAVEVRGVASARAVGGSSGLGVALARGRRIEIGRGFDAPTLAQLLGVLERT